MNGPFSQLVVLSSSAMLLTALIVLWRKGLPAYITAYRWQSWLLGVLTAVVGYFGRDAALWLTASALCEALRPIGVEIAAVELPTSLGPASAYTTLPAIDHGYVSAPSGPGLGTSLQREFLARQDVVHRVSGERVITA